LTNNVTYADVALINVDGRIYAGVELLQRQFAEDGRSIYDPYHVISWAGEIKTASIRQAIPVILTQAVRQVDRSHDVVIFRSFNRAFERSAAIRAAIQLVRPLTVKIEYVPREKFTRYHGQNALLLANDAVRRGYTLDAQV